MFDRTIWFDYIGGNCPVQAEGTIGGYPFYFRARGERWYLEIYDHGESDPWLYEEDYPHGQFSAGWMPQYEALHFIAKAFKLWATNKEDIT